MASHLWSSVTITMIFGGFWGLVFSSHDQKKTNKKTSLNVLIITGRILYLGLIVLENGWDEFPSGHSCIPTIFGLWDFHPMTESPVPWFPDRRTDSQFPDHGKCDMHQYPIL